MQKQPYEPQNLTTVWKVSMFGVFFWCKFFPTFKLNMKTYRVSPVFTQNVLQYGPDQPRMRTPFT